MAELTENFLRESFSVADLNDGMTAHGVLESSVVLPDSFTPVVRMMEAAASKIPAGCVGLVEGVAAKTDIINRNRRFYSKEVFKIAVTAAQELIKAGQFLGEVDHPWMGSLAGAAVRFTKLWIEGDLVKFEAVILETEHGVHLKKLLDGGVGVMVSTRGYASTVPEVKKVGDHEITIGVIQADFRLEGIDFVLFPSNPAGKVTKHEQDNFNHSQEKHTMDLEKLRKDHPELVAQIETAAREGYVAQAAVDAAVEAARVEARKEVSEGEEVTGLRSLLSAVTGAITPFVPALKAESEKSEKSESEKAIEALTAQVQTLTESLQAEKTAVETAKAEAAKTEAKSALKVVIDGLLEGNAHADLLRPELEALEDEASIKSVFETRNAFIQSVATRIGVAPNADDKGAGQAEKKDGTAVEKTDEELLKQEQRRYAGLPVKS